MASHSNRSIVRESLILAVPSAAVLFAGGLLAWIGKPGYLADAATAVLLVLPVTLASHVVTLRWARRQPSGAFLGMLAGAMLRVMVIVGGGVLLYLGTDWYRPRGVALWVALIAAYVATLAVELALHAGALPNVRRLQR